MRHGAGAGEQHGPHQRLALCPAHQAVDDLVVLPADVHLAFSLDFIQSVTNPEPIRPTVEPPAPMVSLRSPVPLGWPDTRPASRAGPGRAGVSQAPWKHTRTGWWSGGVGLAVGSYILADIANNHWPIQYEDSTTARAAMKGDLNRSIASIASERKNKSAAAAPIATLVVACAIAAPAA